VTTTKARLTSVIVATLLAAAASAADTGQRREDFEVVDCLLPPQVRTVGGRVFQTPRRPTRTTVTECRVRGGEWVSYDRANLETALKIWLTTAQAGDPEAQTTVGEIYERGLGVPPDYSVAAEWYGKAANQGYSRAMYNLGTLHEQGLGVEKDALKALNLYRQAGGLKGEIGFEDAYQQELEKQRAELQKSVEERSAEVDALQKQVEELQRRLNTQANATSAPGADKQVAALQRIVAQLRAERDASSQKLAALPVSRTREPGAVAPAAAAASIPQATPASIGGLKLGRYYALVIGNQNYRRMESLTTPLGDAQRVAQLLEEKYGFSVTSVDDADDVAMLAALNKFDAALKPDDNLLIYYAGHGARLKTVNRLQMGYWLPVNADPPPTDVLWVPTEQVTGHLARLQAKRVLVLADSCYAGLLSDDPNLRYANNTTQVSLDWIKYKLPSRSRLLISSGGDAPVLDEGGQGNSVFARALIDVLQSNKGVLSAPGLFVQLQERVKLASGRAGFTQMPEMKAIKAAGHETGDFFLVPKASR
jgi:hypothetical protein